MAHREAVDLDLAQARLADLQPADGERADRQGADSERADARREAADQVLRVLGNMLTAQDKAMIRRAEADLYDDNGLPR